MNPACVDPALRDSLLDGGRPGGPGFSPEELEHLEICASCCAALEQQRRVAQTWAALEPSPRELARARARLLARPGKRSSAKLVPKAAALVVVLAAAAASAAVQVAVTHFASPPPAPVASVDQASPPARASKPRRFKGSGPRPDAPSEPEPKPTPTPVATDPQPVAPAAVELSVNDLPPAPAPAPAPSVARRAAPAYAPAPPPPAPKATAPETAPASAWMVAASALRVGDYALAEAAFDQLARSGDSSTRDAARLARAQVWIAQGRGAEARPALEGLAAGGATPLVRKRAADLLEALP